MESVFKFWKNMERKTRELLPMQVFPAQVKEVAEEERTCIVRVNDNVDFFDVKLYAVTDKSLKGFCLIPAIDSTVLVARIANANDLYVCSFSEVDKVLGTIGDKVEFSADKESLHYKVDKTDMTVKSNDIQVKTEKVTFTVSDSKVTVDAEEFSFNGGNKGGLININDLTTKINEFIDKFNQHTHQVDSITVPGNGLIAPTGGGNVTGSSTATEGNVKVSGSQVSKLNQTDYEDTKVKH